MSSGEILEMPFLRNIGFVMTYKCQVSCPHCIIEAGPRRRGYVSFDDASNWIQQMAGYRSGYIKILSLTGGEPFFDLERLREIATCADNYGLTVSAVTNAFWAFTPEKALRILRGIPAIKMLAFSTDAYHQLSIPLQRVKNAIFAARTCDIPFHIHVCTENEDAREHKLIMEKLLEITEMDSINIAITFPAGRAMKSGNPSKYRTGREPPLSACPAGSSPIVFPNGRVLACIGPVIELQNSHPLTLGNLRETSLEEILDRAELNCVLHAIRIWGPKKLISIIEEAGLGQYLPSTYIKDSVCNACYCLMANRKIVEFLGDLANKSEFRQKVAYARIFYLKEIKMAELCQLGTANGSVSKVVEN